ncbi:MAG TPA: TonB-dependent receptor [Cyclobacteriaceae bacterium]|nr:TonB-dependent receptor [Cyclobacteriaceae bacterium]
MRKILRLKNVLITLLALVAGVAFAQDRFVTGKVTSAEDGTAVPGVNVVVKGTTNGTTTDADGNYRLSVPASGGTLVFSFIGLTTEELAIGERTIVDINMRADVTQLSEVVVVGYGTQSKRDLSGSIATVSGKEIASLPVQSFEQALGGRAAGVNISIPNGVMNNPPVIRIRGVSSISLSSFPLIVIDGIPTYTQDNSANNAPNNPLANLNPSDIESVEVLKDASASAIYGSRAANGVILITTKKGAQGKTKVTLDSWVGATEAFRLFDVLNAEQYMMMKNEGITNLNANAGRRTPPVTGTAIEGSFKPSLDADGNVIDTDWYDHIYRTGFSHSNSLGVSGATDKTNYYISVGYTAQSGMLKKNDFDRTSARLNLDQKLTRNITIGTNFSYSNTYNEAPSTGSLPGAAFATAGLGRLPLVLPPNVGAFLPDGNYNLNGAGLGAGANLNPTSNPLTPAPLVTGYYNPDIILAENKFTSESNQIQGAVYANWEIIKGLNARTMFGINNVTFEDIAYQTPLAGDGFATGGSATNVFRTNKRWNWQNTLQYDKVVDKHSFSILLGGEQQYTVTNRWGAARTAVGDLFYRSFQGNYTNIAVNSNFQGENYLLSYFSRINYDFNKKYFASFNVRQDGYSAWGEDKWGTFYGGALGYTISEESFWKDSFLNKVSFMKLKASYGEVGNSQGINDFASMQLYGGGLYGNLATLGYAQAGNSLLTWETSKKTDVGFMYGILNDRIQGEFTWYKTVVDGLILDVPQAPSKGIPNVPNPALINTIPANVGSMKNTGIEFSIKFNAITTPNFRWTTNLNFTTLKNEVLSLNTDQARIGNTTLGLETVNYTTVGRSIGTFLAVPTIGINEANGRRMFEKADGSIVQYDHQGQGSGWTNLDGTAATAPSQIADGQFYGPALPTYFGGFDNTFTYKSIDFGVFFQYSGGNYIYNGTKAGLRDQRFWNNHLDILDRWTPENPQGKLPRVVYGDNVSNGSALVISENIEKGDFVRLRNVSLGYTFPKSILEKVSLTNLRVYGSIQNGFVITKYSGIDPENQANGNSPTGAGVDRNSVGQARTYTFGLSLAF